MSFAMGMKFIQFLCSMWVMEDFLDKFTAHCNSMLQKLLSSFCVPLYYLSYCDPKKEGQNLVFPYHGQRNHRYHLPTQVTDLFNPVPLPEP